MGSRHDTTTELPVYQVAAVASELSRLAIVIAWSVHDPGRMGEVAFLTGNGPFVFGRAGTLRWIRHRPGAYDPTGPLMDRLLSREQMAFERGADRRLRVRRVGRLDLRLNGSTVESAPVVDGDVLEVGDRWVLLTVDRAEELPGATPVHAFGDSDAHGIVGEGRAAYALRQEVDFVARRDAHVLIHGPSGTGKELVAQALHTASSRAKGPLVSRNAATIPTSLADAELFGNLANYPNPGMAARPGVVGAAHGGTLFLDEFGELPPDVQARLLRVLDDGEYHCLGEARARTADLRLIAATNRPPESLRHDVLARFPLRISPPPLQARREDIPLIAAHLLRDIASRDAELGELIGPAGVPDMSTRLVAHLLLHPYQTHVRELEAMLWQSIAARKGRTLDLTSGMMKTSQLPVPPASESFVEPAAISPEAIQACLDQCGGRQDLAWRALGLSSRHVLTRLIKKHDLRARHQREVS